MATILPFRALRPQPSLAKDVAALPYDVMNAEEARRLVRGNPLSFLHVEKSEIDVPAGTAAHAPEVYAAARRNLEKLMADSALIRDAQPCLYLYRQVMDRHSQCGVVACVPLADYESGIIKRHETTLADKQEERRRHIDAADAHTGMIFMAHRKNDAIDHLVARIVAAPPAIDFTAEDGVAHTVWVVADGDMQNALIAAFAAAGDLYIADGHTRSAASAAVARERRAKGIAGDHELLPAVLFPHDRLRIMDYNRAVRDLNGLDAVEFLRRLEGSYTVAAGFAAKAPGERRAFGMYLDGRWYGLRFREAAPITDPVKALDVSILQDTILQPLLGIGDPRTDKRIAFIGGIRGMVELERLVDSGDFAVAFSVFPTSLEEVMAVSDAGQVMPPKSTWFEPKLRSGLFVHLLRG